MKESCKLPINQQLLEEEKWYDLSSEMWKWANHIAMMYNEDEADVLVEYVDYTLWEVKKYPKEWFTETYAASFEGFMIPVPSEYNQILIRIYGPYWNPVRKAGMHEYPFYKRQLSQLREYVKRVEERMEEANLIKIEDIQVKEEPTEIPQQWIPVVTKEDGTLKKIILTANEPKIFAYYGDEALDRLEGTLKIFEMQKDKFALWWRPHPVMKKVLEQTSEALGRRYQQILDMYKSAGWGICDETDQTDRAIANSDAYYGNLNAILQPFQNTGKPIMIMQMNEEDRHIGY